MVSLLGPKTRRFEVLDLRAACRRTDQHAVTAGALDFLYDKLRQVVAHLDSTRVGSAGEDDMVAGSNILVG